MKHEAIGQMYTGSFQNVAVTAKQDLFTLFPGIDLIYVLHNVEISQSSDAGDTEMENLKLLYHRQTTANVGSGGTTILLTNGVPLSLDDAITDNVASVIINNTTQATTGTKLRVDGFNVLLGYDWSPSEEERIWSHPDDILIISLETTPADALTLSGTIVFEVIGSPVAGG